MIQSLASAWPDTGPNGQKLTMDQRRWAAFVEVFRRAAAGHPPPTTVGVRREREVGIVLHAVPRKREVPPPLFGDGPAADEPGQLRGLGAPVILDPATAREHARTDLAHGRGTVVLLVGDDGQLHRLVRVGPQPPGGWTRQTLVAAVRDALPTLPPLRVPGYEPSTAITEHVRTARPHCSGYDCPRTARRSDLDHVPRKREVPPDPYPRGPTSVTNLDPKCRRHHQRKTLGLWRSRLHPDGTLTWTTLLGTQITTRHEPLPGCGQ